MSDIKILILGDLNVGKTSFINNLIYDKFNNFEASTIGVNLNFKNYKINDDNINICFIDPSGSSRFSFLNEAYIKDINIVFYLFDLSNPNSFNNIQDKIDIFNKLNNIKSYEYLIGSKSDKTSNIDKNDITEICKQNNIKYYSISNQNSKDFELINNLIYKYLLSKKHDTSPIFNDIKILKRKDRDYYCGWLLPC
jgi:small GTP-binding protein